LSLAEIIEADVPVRRFKPYPAYKESGVEWLGDIPAHWTARRLKHTAKLNPESLPEDTDPASEMVYVDIGGVDSLGRIIERERMMFDAAPSRARRLVRDGDIILSTVRTYLRAIAPIVDPDPGTVVSTGFAVVRPDADLTAEYAAYCLRAPYFVERVVANSKGVSFPAINEPELATYEIAVPPEAEQRAIAAFLNRETARIDVLVAKKEKLTDLLQEQRVALITRAVTKGLDPNAPMKDSGIEWLGEIPEHWVATRLVRLTDQAVPIVYGILLPGPRLDEGVPYIGAGDVKKGLALDDLPRTTEEIASQYPRSRVRAGEIVYAIRGSFGAVEIVPTELEGVNLSRDAARIAPGKHVESRWLCWTLQSDTSQKQFDFNEMGTAVTGVNIRDLKRVLLPCPPPAEQHAIADYLDRQTEEINQLVATIRGAVERLREFRTALISAAVTGKIDVGGEIA
jgi:type I restriction enzyme, S subunit